MLRRPVVAALLTLIAVVVAAGSASAKTVWLCQPGHHPDPCTPGLSTTVYTPKLKKLGVVHPQAMRHPAIDCFYVYPTVSSQPTGNANLHIDPEQRSIAHYQAARYSQYCRIYAPMYRQLTLAGIGEGTPTTKPNAAIAFSDVQNAFKTYLQRYNRGRGFVLLGHSQGSFMLRALIANAIDTHPAIRRHLVSAILLGGNVLVKKGKNIGGDFKHIPGCTSARQLGCVIAYSTFDQPVPTPSLFGRPTRILGTGGSSVDAVLCTNPAALAGGSGILNSIVPSQPFYRRSPLAIANQILGFTLPRPPTVWVSLPGAFSARCSSANDASVLQITPRGSLPTPNPLPTAAWGLHLLDANIALGNLLSIVRTETAAFLASGR